MKLENQVTNLEISKRLRELDVKQESLFYWYDVGNDVYYLGSSEDAANNAKDYPNSTAIGYGQRTLSAFTCDEMSDALFSQPKYIGISLEDGAKWRVQYDIQKWVTADTLADAMGKMLIYLIENGLCPSPSKT